MALDRLGLRGRMKGQRMDGDMQSVGGGMPGASAQSRLELRDLLDCIAVLPPRQRTALHLKWQGYKQREIAAEMGISQQAVSRLLARAWERLHLAEGTTV